MFRGSVSIATPEDLPKLTSLLALWYRSPLETRSQLDYTLIQLVDVTLDHTVPTAARAFVYPDVCICGTVYNPVRGSRLRRWCCHCYGKLGQWLPPIQCEAWILEHAMAKAIVYSSMSKGENKCQDSETLQT